MQVIVDGTPSSTSGKFSLKTLKAAFATVGTTPGVFAATQPQIIVPEAAYNSAYNATLPNTSMTISADTLTFNRCRRPRRRSSTRRHAPPRPPATCAVLDQKTIQELFTLDYGRMNATLGTEVALTNFQTQTTVPLGYVDRPTELDSSRSDAALEDHPQRRGYPLHPLPPVQRAGGQPRGLGRLEPAAWTPTNWAGRTPSG